jgi:hypothetical protein
VKFGPLLTSCKGSLEAGGSARLSCGAFSRSPVRSPVPARRRPSRSETHEIRTFIHPHVMDSKIDEILTSHAGDCASHKPLSTLRDYTAIYVHNPTCHTSVRTYPPYSSSTLHSEIADTQQALPSSSYSFWKPSHTCSNASTSFSSSTRGLE